MANSENTSRTVYNFRTFMLLLFRVSSVSIRVADIYVKIPIFQSSKEEQEFHFTFAERPLPNKRSLLYLFSTKN